MQNTTSEDNVLFLFQKPRTDNGKMFEFQKHTRDMVIPPSGHWSNVHPTTVKIFKAHVTCPLCGMPSTLKCHQIDLDGVVYTPFVCARKGCSFSSNIKLKDWNGGKVK